GSHPGTPAEPGPSPEHRTVACETSSAAADRRDHPVGNGPGAVVRATTAEKPPAQRSGFTLGAGEGCGGGGAREGWATGHSPGNRAQPGSAGGLSWYQCPIRLTTCVRCAPASTASPIATPPGSAVG